jgi:hypothetical protein
MYLWLLFIVDAVYEAFFCGTEVKNIVFFGPTWFPEKWLFQKLYPGVLMLDAD